MGLLNKLFGKKKLKEELNNALSKKNKEDKANA